MDITTLALAKNYTDEQIKQSAIGGVDLTDYLKKEEAYTRQEIDDKVENLDYQNLKNKPFYSEINKYIIPLQEIEFVSGDGEGLPEGVAVAELELSNIISVATNVLYNFTFDDEITQVKFIKDDDSGLFLGGNFGIIDIGEDTGEPYIILFGYGDGYLDSPAFCLYVITTEGKHTIGLSYIGDPVPLIPEGIYNFKEDEYGHYCHYWEKFSGRLQEGEKYKFTFDNTTYEITFTYDRDGDIYKNYEVYRSGNLYLFNRELEDTGENYCILIDWFGIYIYTSTEGDYTVSFEIPQVTEIIHKIDNKYLDIPQIEPDWSVNDETDPAFIKNRTHYTAEIAIPESAADGTDVYWTGPTGNEVQGQDYFIVNAQIEQDNVIYAYKVSNKAIPFDVLNEIEPNKILISLNGDILTAAEFQEFVTQEFIPGKIKGCIIDGLPCIITVIQETDLSIIGQTGIASVGTYFLYTLDNSAPLFTTHLKYDTVKQLDLKYIPDAAFGTLEMSKEGTVATINYTDRNGNLQTINVEDGVKPVRGTDYWTEADKAEIKAYVDNAILGGVW